MKDFLQEIANDIKANYSSELHNLQIVFPNRRAGQFLLRHLANASTSPIWAPQVMSMPEFMEQFIELKRADNLLLCFKLFPIYQRLMPGQETFDQFYPWAEIILRDFNSLDQQLAKAEKVFYHLKDIKELNTDDLLSDEQKEVLSSFYNSFEKGSGTDSLHKTRFMEFWGMLPKLYTEFRAQLLQEKIGYSGLIARQVAESGNFEEVLQGKKVLFCGFNALTKAEEKVIKELVGKGMAHMHWDVDAHMLKPEQEAGLFMRRWQKDDVFKSTFLAAVPNRLAEKLQNSIHLTELPLEHVQSREVGRHLQQQLEQHGVPDDQEFTRTAIVLPDESQLFPLLYQLPEVLQGSTVNITMGVPLRVTPVYNLLEGLLELQNSCGNKDGVNYFYHRHVTNLLRHPYLRGIDAKLAYSKLTDIEQHNMSYVDEHFLWKSDTAGQEQDSFMQTVFSCAPAGKGLAQYLLQVLDIVNTHLRKQKPEQVTLEEEYISKTRTQLERLMEIADEAHVELKTELLEKLIRYQLQQLKVPFVGEPLQGLQIMGMLETRCLDFDNLYILSVNEGVLPAASDEPSLIPYFIRSAYGLPTTDEHDAVYAYNFYRVLQRAKHVHLYYSTYRSGGKQSELSRFVRQLLFELWPTVKPQQLHLQARPAAETVIQLNYAELQDALHKFTDNGETARPLSPSALNTWLHCRMQFGFKYLLNIKEPDELQEDVDASVFGQLMHTVLENFYREFGPGADVTKELIEQKIESKPVLVRVLEAYQQKHGVVPFLGRNSLPIHMIANMVEQVLEVDKAYAPFRIVALEQDYQIPMEVPYGDTTKTMHLKGHIDRVDEKNGEIRVLDYKTGKDTRAFTSIPELFDREINNRNKAAMQVLIYSLLYAQNNRETLDGKTVVPALYNSKELYSKGFDAKLSAGDDKLLALTESQSEEVEQQLKNLLEEVLSADGVLDQREDVDGCKYCGYAGICGR
jgi:ATP-dependent helicase/DNAse subunit B